MSWGKEVRKRLIDMDKTIAEMADALLYEPTYLSKVIREDDPSPRIKRAIDEYVGLDEKKGAE